MSSQVEETELPANALLAGLAQRNGAQTDCFAVRVPGRVTLDAYIRAFFHSPVFRLERIIVAVLAGKPTSYQDVDDLATGATSSFAAWSEEGRSDEQLLLAVTGSRIHTWLMVQPEGDQTRLYFGSGVRPKEGGNGKVGRVFEWANGLHKFYSRVLLSAAAKRL